MSNSIDNRFISFDKASIRLGERILFPNTDWTFASDQHWALLGDNGSGKSIFASALKGDLPLAGGEIRYHFQSKDGEQPENAVVHLSFDQYKRFVASYRAYMQARYESIGDGEDPKVDDFLSQETVEEINPFEVRTVDKDQTSYKRRRDRTIRMFRIKALLPQRVSQLSHGEMRKVVLAQALIKAPRLLILDDPFVGLDAAYRKVFLQVIEKLMRGEMRVLLITSRRSEIPSGITHIAFVEGYRMVAHGPKAQMMQSRRLSVFFRQSDPLKPRLNRTPEANRRGRTKVDPVVEIHRLNIIYDDKPILRDVNWTIRSGERWALMGPNGSGKSTLLGVIYGDNPQSYANDVRIMGRKRGAGMSIWELKKPIGYISSELHLHFDDALNCFEVVCSGFTDTMGVYRSISTKKKRIARQWMNCLGLTAAASDRFGSLSTGIQRMVLMARALVKSPQLLLLDEPCQGLDARHRMRIIHLIDQLARQSDTSIVYVTHHHTDLPNAVERIARMRNGRIIRID